MKMMFFRKNLSLHLVNLVGLAVMLSSVLVSLNYIKGELSYDRQYGCADRIARLSVQFGSEAVDGRIYGRGIDEALNQMPEIERTVKMYRVYSASLANVDTHVAVNDLYMVSKDFLEVFDMPLLVGNMATALETEPQMIISESLARKLFTETDLEKILMQQVSVDEGYRIQGNFTITGIFQDMPETSHFHTDALTVLPEEMDAFYYNYLLLKDNTDLDLLSQKITQLVEEKGIFTEENPQKAIALLMPLTDIHLHSHNLREMAVNGNIKYLYLIAGANILLLIIVLFNLWLNKTLIFSYNRRYYQLLRLYGAPPATVVLKEMGAALRWGAVCIFTGVLITCCLWYSGVAPMQLTAVETGAVCALFLLILVLISIIPAVKGMVYTQFISTSPDLVPVKFSYGNVRWMLVAQYCAVMIVVILAFGIGRQLNLTKAVQVGGDQGNVLLLKEQPGTVVESYHLLREKLLLHSEIEGFTTAFQIPGDAIRDHVFVHTEGSEDKHPLPLMVSGEGFIPFFGIKLVAGRDFSPLKYGYQEEYGEFMNYMVQRVPSDHVEEYILNVKALEVLGFKSAEEALGKMLYIEQGSVDYFHQGVIVGVTEDYNYTGVYQDAIPLLMMQRNMFQFCVLVRLGQENIAQGISTFEEVWKEVYPSVPANYTFMSDTFGKLYSNELRAQKLVLIFALLSFLLADLGLIVFVAFIIRKRTKEIMIRKINGAGTRDIVLMLNMDFLRYILYAFIIAVPVSWFILHSWLEQFAYRITLSWWMFLLCGAIVLVISLSSILLQSIRAARR